MARAAHIPQLDDKATRERRGLPYLRPHAKQVRRTIAAMQRASGWHDIRDVARATRRPRAEVGAILVRMVRDGFAIRAFSAKGRYALVEGLRA